MNRWYGNLRGMKFKKVSCARRTITFNAPCASSDVQGLLTTFVIEDISTPVFKVEDMEVVLAAPIPLAWVSLVPFFTRHFFLPADFLGGPIFAGGEGGYSGFPWDGN